MAGFPPSGTGGGGGVEIYVKTGQELADACLVPNSTIQLDASFVYTVPYPVDVANNVTILGNGATVTIASNDKIFNAISTENFEVNKVKFVAFSNAKTIADGLSPAEKADGTLFIVSATAIEAQGVKGLNVSDCTFTGFRGGAVRCGGVGGGANFDRLNKIYDCNFIECAAGIVAHEDAEYGAVDNCDFNACGWGIINCAGNWTLNDIRVNYSANGIWNVTEDTYISGATGNFIHGAISNVQTNHSTFNPVFDNSIYMQVGTTNYQNYAIFHKGTLIPSFSNLVIYYGDIFYEGGEKPWVITGGTLQNTTITTEEVNNVVLISFDIRISVILGNAVEISASSISTSTDLFFEYSDARFFSELGLPNLQGWTSNNTSIVDDTIFGVDKKSIKFATGYANKPITAAGWADILTFGASYSGILRFENRSSANSLLSGLGFSGTNDPRPSGSKSRILIRINMNSNYIVIGLEVADIILDGQNGNPLVLINDFFHFEAVIEPTPDAGVTFGAINLYVNEVLISTGEINTGSSSAVNNIVSVAPWSGTGAVNFYVDNFGVTIYKEPSTKLLAAADMDYKSISLIVPSGRREYIATLPDGSPRAVGNIFKVVASNSGGSITLRTQDLDSPQVLFNGQNEYLIPIESEKTIIFTNAVNNGNVYQGTIPHEYVMEHDHLGLINLDVFSVEDLEKAFGDTGTYEVTGDVSITFMNDIVIPDVFNIASGVNFIMRASNHALAIDFTNTGTIFTHAGLGEFRITQGKFTFSGDNATLFNLSVSNYICDWVSLLCTGADITLGPLTVTGLLKITNTTTTGFTNGLVINTNLFALGNSIFQTTFGTATVIRFESVTGQASMTDSPMVIGANENIFWIDPIITGKFRITGVSSFLVQGNFFESGSLTQVSKYVDVRNASEQIASNTGTAMSVKDNVLTTTILANPAWNNLNLNTVILGDLNSRFTLLDAVTGKRRYDGLHPIKMAGSVSLSAVRGTAGIIHSFRMVKTVDNGSDPLDAVEISSDLGTKAVSVSWIYSGTFHPGDEFLPQVMTASGTTDITVISYSDIIQ